MQGLLDAIGAPVRSQGFYVSGNASVVNDLDGSLTKAWWTSIAPDFDGFAQQYFEMSGGNYALWNGGPVDQNSGNTVWAPASNSATQTNNQSNVAQQSQSVSGDGCCPEHGCESCHPSCEPRCEPECEPECEPNPCKPKDQCGHPRRDCE